MLVDIKAPKISKCVVSVASVVWPMKCCSLDHLFRFLLSTCYVPCVVLGAQDVALKTKHHVCLSGAYSLEGGRRLMSGVIKTYVRLR